MGDTVVDDLFDALQKVRKDIEASGAKQYITLNPLAMAHVVWLIENGHLQPGDNQIADIMAADKKLGITPWDWPKYS